MRDRTEGREASLSEAIRTAADWLDQPEAHEFVDLIAERGRRQVAAPDGLAGADAAKDIELLGLGGGHASSVRHAEAHATRRTVDFGLACRARAGSSGERP